VYRAISSWFVKVTDFRDRMVELNEEITWQPAHIKGGQFRQVARERPRLVDQSESILGVTDPRLAVRRPELSAH
jgi:hypothetical protein